VSFQRPSPDGPSAFEPDGSGWVARAAGWARRAWPGSVLAWFAVALTDGIQVVWSRGALGGEPLAQVFAAGCLALVVLPMFAVLVVARAVIGPPPPVSSPGLAMPAASVRRLLAVGLGAAALGYPVARLAVQALFPATLAFADRFAQVGGVYGALLCGCAASRLLWPRLGLSDRPFPWASAAGFVLLAKLVTQQPLAQIARAQVMEVELGLLAVLVVLLCARPPAARWRHAILVLSVAMLASLAALLGLASRRPGARGALAGDFLTASSVLYRAAALWDLDGDGFPALLLPLDCDDDDPAVHPAALERVGNGIDDNCAGGDLAQAVLPVAASVAAGARPRSLVLISIDALRADMLPAQAPPGQPLAMPELTAFARGAARFNRAYAQAPFTNDSLRSVMTGDYPMSFRHGDQDLGSEPHLVELLSTAGYRSLAQSPHTDMRRGWLMYRGFQQVDERVADRNAGFDGVTSEWLTTHAIAHFDRLRATPQPFLHWVHYLDPHLVHMPHDGTPFAGSDLRSAYHREVWHTDRELGRFLRHLEQSGFLDEGLVVIISDHGEQLGEQGRTGHSYWLSEATLRVPLVLRGAGVPAGEIQTRVRLVDLYPTLLRIAAGIVTRTGGEDLGPVLAGVERADRPVLARTLTKILQKRALIEGDWKLIEDERSGGLELYDLAHDPGELHNRVDAEPTRLRRLQRALGRAWDVGQNDVLLNWRGRAGVQRDCRAGVQAACEYLRAHP
jgi:arylsulfatase A-like enzyme